jgi:hypothetical protein
VLRRGPREGFTEIDSTRVDTPGPVGPRPSPYAAEAERQQSAPPSDVVVFRPRTVKVDRARSVIRMPSFEAVEKDPVLYAHTSRVLHLEANPGDARGLVQAHGDRDLWVNAPPVPPSTPGRVRPRHQPGLPCPGRALQLASLARRVLRGRRLATPPSLEAPNPPLAKRARAGTTLRARHRSFACAAGSLVGAAVGFALNKY